MPNKHGAKVCNNVAMAVLKCYGIHRSDIILPVNDTTNVFVTIG